jgi:hypothetical protein
VTTVLLELLLMLAGLLLPLLPLLMILLPLVGFVVIGSVTNIDPPAPPMTVPEASPSFVP